MDNNFGNLYSKLLQKDSKQQTEKVESLKEQEIKVQEIEKDKVQEDLSILEQTQKENGEKILASNLAILQSIDLKDYIKNLELKTKQMRHMLVDLIDLIQLDDSVIANLRTLSSDLTQKDIDDIASTVEEFNINGKFATLAEYWEKELIELLGEKKFKSKLSKSKALKTKRKVK